MEKLTRGCPGRAVIRSAAASAVPVSPPPPPPAERDMGRGDSASRMAARSTAAAAIGALQDPDGSMGRGNGELGAVCVGSQWCDSAREKGRVGPLGREMIDTEFPLGTRAAHGVVVG